MSQRDESFIDDRYLSHSSHFEMPILMFQRLLFQRSTLLYSSRRFCTYKRSKFPQSRMVSSSLDALSKNQLAEVSDVESHRMDREEENLFTSSYSLKAISVSRQFNLVDIYSKFFKSKEGKRLPDHLPLITIHSQFAIIPLSKQSINSSLSQSKLMPSISEKDQFVILYNFGAVVLFNVDNVADHPSLVDFFNLINLPVEVITRDHEESHSILSFVEDYGIAVDSRYNVLEHGHYADAYPEKIILRKIDFESLKIISHILAHSAALHLTRALMNRFIERFEEHLNDLDKEDNDSIVTSWIKRWGVNEKIVINIQELTKVQLSFFKQQKAHEWSVAAWYHEEYDEVRTMMLEEFAMKSRMQDLQSKLDYMTLNFKTFFEISASKEGAASERAIVLFFFIELVLTVYEIYHLS